MNNIQPLTDKATRLDVLVQGLIAAKEQEAKMREARIALEKEIVDIVGVKDEGAFSYKTDLFKITTTGKVSRKLHLQKYQQIKDQIPEKLRPVVYKPEIKKSLIKYLQNKEPDYYKVMTQCMTTAPRKPAVKVEPIE